MKNIVSVIVVAAFFILAVLVFASMFVVTEAEQVFKTQFGKPVGEPIREAGVYFKTPFIQDVRRFDRRYLEWDGASGEVTTKDKTFIEIDTYARWQIKNPLTFFQQLTSEAGAQGRLDGVLDGETKKEIASHSLVEMIRSSQREAVVDESTLPGEQAQLQPFSMGRSKLAQSIIDRARPRLLDFGIDLLDFRFKRINYSSNVRAKIFDRMTSERKRIAAKFRSEGAGEASKILGQQDRELKTIQSEAYRQQQEIRGKADAEATAIYAAATNPSEETRQFYEFLKTMEMYEKTISEKDLIILSTDSDFFKFLKNAQPE